MRVSSQSHRVINRLSERLGYIVDTVFDSAILIAGVGRNQDAVAIKRVKQ